VWSTRTATPSAAVFVDQRRGLLDRLGRAIGEAWPAPLRPLQ
jgi:hypothetical protein